MPIDVYRNSNVYNMVAEGEIAEILSKFNTSYVMDVINYNINNRFAYNQSVANPNIVNSYEINFKGMLNNFPNDGENIMLIRQETYLTIINKICDAFNLQYIGDSPDCYVLAYHMYDVFVSGFARSIINFFAKYIYMYKNEIYNNMGLDKYKKNKDSTTNYMRKAFDNYKNIDVIIAHIKDVVYYISGFDIDFYVVMSFSYPKEVCDLIYSNVVPMRNIFKEEFCKVLAVPAILTEIRIAIQSLMTEEMTQQSVIQSKQEENDEEETQEEETE